MTQKEYYVGEDFKRVPSETISQLKEFGACIAADAMKGYNSMDSRIHSVENGTVICGCAVTVRLRPGDNLMLHKAIEMSQPGDIIVVDTCCSYRNAIIGGIMSGAAFGKGIGGLVIDGAVRDVEELRENHFPVFAAAVVPNTGGNDTAGQINHPISCGNVPVLPGDIIIGDDNGVVVVPQNCVDFVLKACLEKKEAEEKRIAEIQKGKITGDGIHRKLEKLGF